MRPVIGVTAGFISQPKRGMPTSRPYDYLKSEYSELLTKCGGFPILLPNLNAKELAGMTNEFLSGLLFSGGSDVYPGYYKDKTIHPKTRYEQRRDNYELSLARHFKGPILGICRGLQLITVAFGGKLYQDIATDFRTDIDHGSPERISSHKVNIKKGTLLHRILKQESIMVNSSHHQGIKQIPEGFVVSAISEDGLPEAIESKEGFILAVQWHPEREPDEANLKIIKAFVEVTKKA